MITNPEVELDLQIACDTVPDFLTTEQLIHWLQIALRSLRTDPAEVTIRLVEKTEIQQLNRDYRQKDKPTNVLSFPFEAPPGFDQELPLLGDMVICCEIIAEEAQQQNKQLIAHWAHMVVHGTLHLCNYDHIEPEQAEEMEALERSILAELDFADPYAEDAED